MDMNPILAAIEDGHFQRTVSSQEAHDLVKAGDRLCRKDGESFPCSTILAARAQNSRRLAAQSRASLVVLTPNPAFR